MREIKFRGKRLDNGEWEYGFHGRGLIDVIEDEEIYRHFIIVWDIDGYFVDYEVDGNTVGQYTGLKDINGREIYEGDIFHLGDKNIKYQVVWNDTGLIGKQVGSTSCVGLEFWKDKIQVIGNIYENPELLR